MNDWTRRDFLRAAGLGAGAMALTPFLPTLDAAAQTGPAGARAKRLIVFCHGNGSLLEYWRPSSGGRTDWAAGQILAPLTEAGPDRPNGYRDQMLLLDGIDNISGYKEDPKISGHSNATCLWTGAYPLPGEKRRRKSSHMSIETAIGEHIAADVDVPFPYLHFGIGHPLYNNLGYNWFYRDSDEPHYVEYDPRAAFDRIFAGFTGDSATLERLRGERKSVLDLVRRDLSQLRRSVAGEQRQRLDAHLAAVRDLERRRTDDSTPICSLPATPDAFDEDGQRTQDVEQHMAYIDAQFDMMVSALRCDLTRVIGFNWGSESATGSGEFIDGYDEVEDHCVADNDRCARNIHRLSHYSNEDDVAREFMLNLNRFHARNLRKLVDLLAATPDPTGPGSLLDDTIIVWGTALSHGFSHSGRNAPHVIIEGGADPYFRTGEYHRWGDYGDWSTSFRDHGGHKNNELLVSLAHAYGLNIDHFGEPDVVGSLDEEIARG